jgi:hypothetical protein
MNITGSEMKSVYKLELVTAVKRQKVAAIEVRKAKKHIGNELAEMKCANTLSEAYVYERNFDSWVQKMLTWQEKMYAQQRLATILRKKIAN